MYQLVTFKTYWTCTLSFHLRAILCWSDVFWRTSAICWHVGLRPFTEVSLHKAVYFPSSLLSAQREALKLYWKSRHGLLQCGTPNEALAGPRYLLSFHIFHRHPTLVFLDSMFGSIGTFNATGSKFNHAAGDQYNTTGTPTGKSSKPCTIIDWCAKIGMLTRNARPIAGMVGPMDPQFRRFVTTSASTSPASPKRAKVSMFGEIDHFNADGSVFNNAGEDQYNYSINNRKQPVSDSVHSILTFCFSLGRPASLATPASPATANRTYIHSSKASP
jgi:hypothetical protein